MTLAQRQSAPARRRRMPWERNGRPALTGSWWARALRLDERCAAGVPAADPAPGEDAAVIAGIRMERWRTAFSHIAADTLGLQTADYGCTPSELRRLLAESPEDLARRVRKPAWAEDVERVAATAAGSPADPEGLPDETWQQGLARILEPFVAESLRLFDAQTAQQASSGVIDLASARAALRTYVAQRLLRLAVRVFVLELNVLRVTGRLDGDSPADRFRSFIRHYRCPDEFAALLDEYAVLARLLITTAHQAADAHSEALFRFVADRDLIVRELFDGADPGVLTAVRLGRGDTHARGRSVGIAEFASGQRAVYKPRPIALHRHFNDVLRWYGERLPADARLRSLAVLDRGEYGWVEFVEPADCADVAAAERYFFRQGELLALLHCLAGVDFHFENLIAVGDQPVPIDLETIFCVEMPRSYENTFTQGDPAFAQYRESVGRVGLLPAPLTGRDGRSFDAGGMGGDAEASLPFPVVDWEAAGTDEMRATRVLPVLGRGHHRPRLDGVDLDALDHTPTLLDGFRTGYRVLAEARGELAAADGPLAAFAADSVRTIVRPTHDYTVLLAETTHPDVMREALDREQVFGVLWARTAVDRHLARVVRHEAEDLWAGDVPLFTTTASSRDLRTADGRLVEDVLPESGLERVRRTFAGLGPAHLERQLWIASAHLATRSTGTGLAVSFAPSAASAVDAAAASDEELCERALAAARAVADRLEASSYRDAARIGWLGLDFSATGSWSVRPLGVDLYNGYAGIALFLAQIAAVTGSDRYAGLARGVLGSMTGYVHEQTGPARPASERPVELGAFTGLAGVALTFASSAVLLDDAALAAPVAPLLDFAADRLRADAFDLTSGAAGILAVAESLAADYGTPAARLADRCVEILLSATVPADGGVAWPGPSPRPLLGFSHGVAGIAWALLAYARRTGDQEAEAAARRALRHEHAAYDERRGNWPDHRVEPPADQYTWCHGAPGVGLARAAGLAAFPGDERDIKDLRRALDGTERYGAHGNHSLCHGELGNLELFALARTTPDTDAGEQWRRRAAAVVARIERGGPVCGTPAGVPTPGLMVGLAGIGHGLLRIAAAGRVPPAVLLAASTRT